MFFIHTYVRYDALYITTATMLENKNRKTKTKTKKITRTNYNDDCIHKHKLQSVGCKYLLRKPATMLNTRTIITLHNIIQMLPMLCVCVFFCECMQETCVFGRSFCCVLICSYKNGHLRILVCVCMCVFYLYDLLFFLLKNDCLKSLLEEERE